jgi:hypothetical protein
VVQVCALAYRYGTGAAEGPLSLDASVGLVCLDRTTCALALMTLDDFERTYPSGSARGFRNNVEVVPGQPPERMTGWAADPLDSIVAREAAELVSGLRGHYVWFTFDDEQLTPWIAPSEDPGLPPPEGTVLWEGLTVAVRPDRPPPSSVVVTLAVSGAERTIVPSEDTMPPDAMFWTDGSVEKLLLPYYASVKGNAAPFFTLWLMTTWDGHIPAGDYEEKKAAHALRKYFPSRATQDVSDDPPPSEVYAITHLPRSEYVSDTGAAVANLSPALEHRTAVMTFDGTGFDACALFRSA